MSQIVLKFVITAAIVVAISELGRRSTAAAALLAVLPIISIMSMIWLHFETRDAEKIIRFSDGVFFLVLPTLIFFVMLSALLRRGVGFPKALALSCVAMTLIYLGYAPIVRRFGAPI